MEGIIALFETGRVVELTKEQELAILRHVVENEEYLGCGTSRAVYSFMDKYVVKIGLSEEGRLQNDVERDFYHRHWLTDLFATLYATGTLINVAERLVDLEQCDEETFIEVVEELNDVTDYDGGDNEQIGYSQERGLWVAYDYGYSSDYSNCDLVGNMDEWTYDLEIAELVIESLETDHLFTYTELNKMAKEAYEESEED